MRTQGSDVYDLNTHIRDCEQASKWCHEYADAPLPIEGSAAEEHDVDAPAEKRQKIDNDTDTDSETISD